MPDDAAPISSSRRWLILLLALAALLRIVWGQMQPVDEPAMFRALPDQREYLELGRNLLEHGELRFVDPRFGDTVYAFRMPGYPAFVALCGGSVRVIRLAQALLDVSTVLAAYLLARRWMGARAGLLAGTIVAFNPFLIFFSALILTETLYCALLAWGMVLLAWRRNYLFGGLVLALSILVRPSALGLALVLGIISVFLPQESSAHEPRDVKRRRFGLPVGATMLLLTLAVLAPWAYRNHERLGVWLWTTTNDGFTAYDGWNPDADGSSDQRFVGRMPELQKWNEVERSIYLTHLAREWARQNPWRAITLAGRKIARTFSPVPLSDDYGNWMYRLAGLAFTMPVYLLVIWSLLRSRLSKSAKAFLLAPMVYFTVVHAISVGSLRYRMPAEAPMAVLAAAGLTYATPRQDWKRAEADAPIIR